MKQCENCGKQLFLIDETVTYLEIIGDTEKNSAALVFSIVLA